jgi:hypothetical protein
MEGWTSFGLEDEGRLPLLETSTAFPEISTAFPRPFLGLPWRRARGVIA